MKRFLGAVILVTALALAAACGSGGGEEQPAGGRGGGPSVDAGQAPPVAESFRVDTDGDTVDEIIEATAASRSTAAATPTAVATPTAAATPRAESTPSAAANLPAQIGELVLSESDVPVGFSSLASMDFDFDLDSLGLPSYGGVAAHMSMFATPGNEDMIVSVVILMEDDRALQEAFSQIDDLSTAELQDAFNMMGAYSQVTLLNTRELDVSGLGERAYGLALTMELPQVGTMDSQMVFFGEGRLLAVAMTMAMGGGTAVDVLPLAAKMADKIEAALQ